MSGNPVLDYFFCFQDFACKTEKEAIGRVIHNARQEVGCSYVTKMPDLALWHSKASAVSGYLELCVVGEANSATHDNAIP